MSPQLARSDFFLTVLNEPAESHALRVQRAGPLAGALHQALLRLAEHVRAQTTCTPEDIAQLNRLLAEGNALQLRLVSEGEEGDPIPACNGPLGRTTLKAVIGGGYRIYVEAIISLLEALERGPLELSRCEECGAWYIPYSRAAVTRFCSTRCRNRFNYRIRRQAVPHGTQEEVQWSS